MKHREPPPLEPELEALLDFGRIERQAPADVRARAIARGRAIVAAGGRIPAPSALKLLTPPLAPPRRMSALVRIGLPTSFAAAVVAIGAVAALRGPSPAHAPTPAPSTQPAAVVSAHIQDSSFLPQSITPETVAPPPVPPPNPVRSARPDGELGATELQLLGRAQAAYSHRDFSRAIALVGELTRRFPNGHLAEEREALRVRSLFGAGRTSEGRRAAAAFATRFPRSVLLPTAGKP